MLSIALLKLFSSRCNIDRKVRAVQRSRSFFPRRRKFYRALLFIYLYPLPLFLPVCTCLKSIGQHVIRASCLSICRITKLHSEMKCTRVTLYASHRSSTWSESPMRVHAAHNCHISPPSVCSHAHAALSRM